MRDYEGIVNMTEKDIVENLLEVALYWQTKKMAQMILKSKSETLIFI